MICDINQQYQMDIDYPSHISEIAGRNLAYPGGKQLPPEPSQ
jgi:hypothetical protein